MTLGRGVSVTRILFPSQTKTSQTEQRHQSWSGHSHALITPPKNRTFVLSESLKGCDPKRPVNHFLKRDRERESLGGKLLTSSAILKEAHWRRETLGLRPGFANPCKQRQETRRAGDSRLRLLLFTGVAVQGLPKPFELPR